MHPPWLSIASTTQRSIPAIRRRNHILPICTPAASGCSAPAANRRSKCISPRRPRPFIAKRMPGTGSDHAATCPSYEPPPSLSGLAPLLGTAILEDPAKDITTLRLAFVLTRRGSQPPPAAGSGEPADRAKRLSRLVLAAACVTIVRTTGATRLRGNDHSGSRNARAHRCNLICHTCNPRRRWCSSSH